MSRKKRKVQHIDIALSSPDGPSSSGFEDIHLVNNPLPELDMEQVELKTCFLGKQLNYPLIINSITGGTKQAGKINLALALIARQYRLAMAVGSQAIAIDEPGLRDTFGIVRDANPDGLLIANIGAATPVDEALKAVEMIAADALQIHFNIPQELAMAEGGRNFKGMVNNIRQIVYYCPVPVIAKEVGFGLSRESVRRLYECGIKVYDTGGKGGTNFIRIEDQRKGLFNGELDDWGIQTAASLAEIVSLGLPVTVIASGGIRSAADAAKALATGAHLLGMAAPFLKILLKQGSDKLNEWTSAWLYRLKAVFLMTGAANLESMRKTPLIITGQTAEWLRARGIDPLAWAQR